MNQEKLEGYLTAAFGTLVIVAMLASGACTGNATPAKTMLLCYDGPDKVFQGEITKADIQPQRIDFYTPDGSHVVYVGGGIRCAQVTQVIK